MLGLLTPDGAAVVAVAFGVVVVGLVGWVGLSLSRIARGRRRPAADK